MRTAPYRGRGGCQHVMRGQSVRKRQDSLPDRAAIRPDIGSDCLTVVEALTQYSLLILNPERIWLNAALKLSKTTGPEFIAALIASLTVHTPSGMR